MINYLPKHRVVPDPNLKIPVKALLNSDTFSSGRGELSDSGGGGGLYILTIENEKSQYLRREHFITRGREIISPPATS